MIHTIIHLGLHVTVPYVVSKILFHPDWKRAFILMVLTMIVDLDHLLAAPVFDPGRCSLGFHPLHSIPAIGFYSLMICFSRTRIIGLGLMIHMALDGVDCMFM